MCKAGATAVMLVVCVVLFHQDLGAQKSRKPLTKNPAIELLESGVAPKRVETLSKQFGIAFEETLPTESQVHDADATEKLLGHSVKSLPGYFPERPRGSRRPRPAG